MAEAAHHWQKHWRSRSERRQKMVPCCQELPGSSLFISPSASTESILSCDDWSPRLWNAEAPEPVLHPDEPLPQAIKDAEVGRSESCEPRLNRSLVEFLNNQAEGFLSPFSEDSSASFSYDDLMDEMTTNSEGFGSQLRSLSVSRTEMDGMVDESSIFNDGQDNLHSMLSGHSEELLDMKHSTEREEKYFIDERQKTLSFQFSDNKKNEINKTLIKDVIGRSSDGSYIFDKYRSAFDRFSVTSYSSYTVKTAGTEVSFVQNTGNTDVFQNEDENGQNRENDGAENYRFMTDFQNSCCLQSFFDTEERTINSPKYMPLTKSGNAEFKKKWQHLPISPRQLKWNLAEMEQRGELNKTANDSTANSDAIAAMTFPACHKERGKFPFAERFEESLHGQLAAPEGRDNQLPSHFSANLPDFRETTLNIPDQQVAVKCRDFGQADFSPSQLSKQCVTLKHNLLSDVDHSDLRHPPQIPIQNEATSFAYRNPVDEGRNPIDGCCNPIDNFRNPIDDYCNSIERSRQQKPIYLPCVNLLRQGDVSTCNVTEDSVSPPVLLEMTNVNCDTRSRSFPLCSTVGLHHLQDGRIPSPPPLGKPRRKVYRPLEPCAVCSDSSLTSPCLSPKERRLLPLYPCGAKTQPDRNNHFYRSCGRWDAVKEFPDSTLDDKAQRTNDGQMTTPKQAVKSKTASQWWRQASKRIRQFFLPRQQRLRRSASLM